MAEDLEVIRLAHACRLCGHPIGPGMGKAGTVIKIEGVLGFFCVVCFEALKASAYATEIDGKSPTEVSDYGTGT